ncbi:uncharacterized protein [Prorops nasuta]|uniref:uncharacterized protein isoform X2 n=1 Tax=Prorops nasuta TaxID=863751 RepID=UPI0034CD8887
MDPVGPWYASYNRLATGNAASTFQTISSNSSGEFVSHHLSTNTTSSLPSNTASQLLLQAAHNTATLACQPTPFNSGGFLSPPPVGYDVFSPLFHHSSSKQTHYANEHRQTLAQSQAQTQSQTQTIIASKDNSTSESEISTPRENYSTLHQATFFEHPSVAASPAPPTLAWNQQSNAQLPSPFGILPHKSVVSSSPGPSAAKTSNTIYENTLNTHFTMTQTLNDINSQIGSASATNYPGNKKTPSARSPSPLINPKTIVSAQESDNSQSFYRRTPILFSSETITSSYVGSAAVVATATAATPTSTNSSATSASTIRGSEATPIAIDVPGVTPVATTTVSTTVTIAENQTSDSNKLQPNLNLNQQSCIVPTPSNSLLSKEYRIAQLPDRTGPASAIFLNASGKNVPSSLIIEKRSMRGINFVNPTPDKAATPIQQGAQIKTQVKAFSNLNNHSEQRRNEQAGNNENQSSPISFSIMDTHRINYTTNSTTTCNNSNSNSNTTTTTATTTTGTTTTTTATSGSKMTNTQRAPSNSGGNNGNGVQSQSQQQYHLTSQQRQQQSQESGSYRHYVSGSTSDTEYHHPNRLKSTIATDSTYTGNNVQVQNGLDCSVVVPRRSSPLQAHSQASPLGHVPSPVYPLYNSPLTVMSQSPSPLQQHVETNGSAYKTAVQQQKVITTPPSPLDVTIPRSVSQGQVAYPSVITRALVTTDSNKILYSPENKAYDNRQQDYSQSQKQQMCWENDNNNRHGSLNRKFSIVSYQSGAEDSSLQAQTLLQTVPLQLQQHQHQLQRALNISPAAVRDGQPVYFDSNQVTLQDLSGCRGDPMSIVKTLQIQSSQQQNPCEVQQVNLMPLNSNEESKQIEEKRNKKKKSLDKNPYGSSLNDIAGGTATMTEFLTRIPPPAHHNVNQNHHHHHHHIHHHSNPSSNLNANPNPNPHHLQQQPQQQQSIPQQNGTGYFEYDRWNLPATPSKVFSSASVAGTFTSQASLQHPNATNFIGNHSTHQHQSLVVSQHGAPPSVPYFSTFHIPPNHHSHHSHEFQQSSGITATGFHENSTNQNMSYGQQQDTFRDEQPKVIVPNIEEELEFLQQNLGPLQNVNNSHKAPKCTSKDPHSGFMTSYLKFLQGERDPSPPPAIRGGRKAAWNKPGPYISVEKNKSLSVPDSSINCQVVKAKTEKSIAPIETPAIDYANDPRYFPLPKERKKHVFDSSDDGCTSDDDFPFPSKKTEKKISNTNNLNNNSGSAMSNSKVEIKPRKGRPIKPGGPTDRKRKAAAAAAALTSTGKSTKKTEEVDPLLLPPRRETCRRKAKEMTSVKQLLNRQQGIDYSDNDDEQGDSDADPAWTPTIKPVGDEEDKRKKRGRPVISKKSKKLFEEDGYSSEDVVVPKKSARRKVDKSRSNDTSLKLSCKIDEKLLASVSDEDIDISPFKSGEFVVIKTDLNQEYPALWRIDGKTLLQKYEPFKSNGRILYRNISTYSGWTPQNRHIYQQVPVKFWQQGKAETIVEFLREEVIMDDSESIERFMKETEKYQENFEVYIQTLISQALDSNFLTEIFQEQDEYFLSNVKTVDEVTEQRKRRLLSITNWHTNIVTAMSTWPCLNIIKDISLSEQEKKYCAGCQQTKVYARVLLYGQPYNSTTLEGSPPNPKIPQEKDFLLCRVCQKIVRLYNKVAHQKYLMFLECARRVADKRSSDQNKDTTIILNELLADEVWLNQLFKEVRSIWAEIDSMEEHFTRKVSTESVVASSKSESNQKAALQVTSEAQITATDSFVSAQNSLNSSEVVTCHMQIDDSSSK